MASFVASRASRAARSTRFPRHASMAGNTSAPKGNDIFDTLQADIAALKKATLSDAGPILLRLLQSVEFHDYAVVNGLLPAGIRECSYTYVYGGVIIVDTPTRPNSPTTMDGSNFMVREGPEGSSPASTHRSISVDGPSESSYDLETDMLAYLKGI